MKTTRTQSGKVSFLNTPEDMSWLAEVHTHGQRYAAALVYGNEDWPIRIECFESANPLHTDKPVQIYAPDEAGDQQKLIR
jgi:hypothetical protein